MYVDFDIPLWWCRQVAFEEVTHEVRRTLRPGTVANPNWRTRKAPGTGHPPKGGPLKAGGLTYGFYQADFTRPDFVYSYDGMFIVRPLPDAKDSDPTIGLDYDFRNGTTQPATLALMVPNELGFRLGVLITVTAGPQANPIQTDSIGAQESANASLETNVATLSGTYAVQGRSVNASLKFSARIENGHLTATASDGCTVDATLRP